MDNERPQSPNHFKNWALFAAWFAAMLSAVAIGFAAWNSGMAIVQPGDAMTSSWWNAVVSNVLDLDSRVSALSSDSSKAPFIRLALAQCSWGGCWGNHAVNTWHDVSAFNYTWNQLSNNDTATFSHNGKWRITVLKPGTYRIKLEGMVMPSVTTSWVQAICPFVSGAQTCLGVTSVYSHQYSPAGYWIETNKDFIVDLTANQTVAFGYYTPITLTYWAHDSYTAIQVEKLN